MYIPIQNANKCSARARQAQGIVRATALCPNYSTTTVCCAGVQEPDAFVVVPGVLDVLTALSDCRHETVEKIMERRISGVSYMCWIDFHNGIWGCGLLCTLLIIFYFTANTPRATTPHVYITGYHAEGYHAPSIPHGPPRLYHHCTAITSVYIPAKTRSS